MNTSTLEDIERLEQIEELIHELQTISDSGPGNRTDAKSLKPVDRCLKNEFGLDAPRVMDRGIATWEKRYAKAQGAHVG